MNDTIDDIKKAGQLFKPIPRVKGLPFIGQTMQIVKDPLRLLLHLKHNYNDMVTVRLGFKDFILLQSPSAARHVLQENARNYFKPGAAKLMKKLLGDGLATSNGDLWLRQRRLMQPAFHKQRLNDFFVIIQDETLQLSKKWKQNKEWHLIDISTDFLKLTLNNITKAMFGSDVETKMDEIGNVLRTMQEFSSQTTKSLVKIPTGIPTKKNNQFKNAEKRFEKIIYEIIEQRNKAKKNVAFQEKHDLLEMLISAYDDDTKTYMTSQQLRDEITTIFMAGHETTSQSLSWIFYQLALNPKIYEAVKTEATANQHINSIDTLQNLYYTRSLIEEAMRFYPPVWIIARKSASDDIINGYKLPAGSTVLINVYGMHHDTHLWKKPGEFDPTHFSNQAKELIPPFSYLPFGGGQRICIGNHFAMMVMQTVVTMMVSNFEFKIPGGFVPEVDPNLTLRAKNGIQLLVKPTN